MTTTKKRGTTLDLTQGPVLIQMIKFCIPILLGNIMQQLYNMVDAAIVGKYVGTQALAAVGATGAITFLIIGFVNGMCAGFGIPIARAFGANDKRLLRRSIMNMVYLGVFFAILLTIITNIILRRLLVICDFPAEIIHDSETYLRIIFLGIPFTIFYNSQAGMLRALGNSRVPLYILAMSSVLNIVLDITLVTIFNLAVLGVAIATITSQIVSGVVCFIYICRSYKELAPKPDERAFVPAVAKSLFLSGIPMALQYSITAIGSVLIQVAVNNLGATIVASITAANKVQTFVHLPFSTLGTAISTFCGQNMGARNYERIKKCFRVSMAIAIVYSFMIGAVMFFGGQYISLIFLDTKDPMIAEMMFNIDYFCKRNAVLFIFLAILTVYRFGLQGLEYGVTAMFAGLFEMVARAVVALGFAPRFGFDAICFANPAAWFAACVLLVPAYIFVIRKVKRRLLGEPDTEIKE